METLEYTITSTETVKVKAAENGTAKHREIPPACYLGTDSLAWGEGEEEEGGGGSCIAITISTYYCTFPPDSSSNGRQYVLAQTHTHTTCTVQHAAHTVHTNHHSNSLRHVHETMMYHAPWTMQS